MFCFWICTYALLLLSAEVHSRVPERERGFWEEHGKIQVSVHVPVQKYLTHVCLFLFAIQCEASIVFRENHPDLIEERKKSDLPEKPKTPQQLWYIHEKKAYMKIHPEVKEFGRGKKNLVVIVLVESYCVVITSTQS